MIIDAIEFDKSRQLKGLPPGGPQMSLHQRCIYAVEYIKSGAWTRIDFDELIIVSVADEIRTAESVKACAPGQSGKPAAYPRLMTWGKPPQACGAAIAIGSGWSWAQPLTTEADDSGGRAIAYEHGGNAAAGDETLEVAPCGRRIAIRARNVRATRAPNRLYNPVLRIGRRIPSKGRVRNAQLCAVTCQHLRVLDPPDRRRTVAGERKVTGDTIDDFRRSLKA